MRISDWSSDVCAADLVEIIAWHGHCEVHELFNAQDVRDLREAHPGVTVLAHPECPPDVVAQACFAGSTAVLPDYVGQTKRSEERRVGDESVSTCRSR